jgi:hypothetical protein
MKEVPKIGKNNGRRDWKKYASLISDEGRNFWR